MYIGFNPDHESQWGEMSPLPTEGLELVCQKITELAQGALFCLLWVAATMSRPILAAYRYHMFRSNTLGTTFNHGKFSEIPSLTQSHPDPLSQNGDLLTLNPFGEGVCLGSSLVFCNKWFDSNQDEKAVKRILHENFSGGAPLEAVVLQAGCSQLRQKNINQDGKWSTKTRIAAYQAMGRSKKLSVIATPLDKKSATQVLKGLQEGQNGVFLVGLHQYSLLGSYAGSHAIVFIKTDDNCYIFDPNLGAGYAKKDQEKASLTRLIKFYGTPRTSQARPLLVFKISPQ